MVPTKVLSCYEDTCVDLHFLSLALSDDLTLCLKFKLLTFTTISTYRQFRIAN